MSRFTLAELHFIRDRVLADVQARPSIRPYLGETTSGPTCPKGHAYRVHGTGQQQCLTCERMAKRQREAAP